MVEKKRGRGGDKERGRKTGKTILLIEFEV
jgi:hypothetical protein